MTEVRSFSERGRDRFEEYLDIKRRHPVQAAAIRDAITLVVADPGKAERDYSIGLGDPQARYFAMPFLARAGLPAWSGGISRMAVTGSRSCISSRHGAMTWTAQGLAPRLKFFAQLAVAAVISGCRVRGPGLAPVDRVVLAGRRGRDRLSAPLTSAVKISNDRHQLPGHVMFAYSACKMRRRWLKYAAITRLP